MNGHRAGFTLIEVVTVVVILGLLLAVLAPAASRSRNASGQADSIHNVALLMIATHMYHADHAGQAPMHACGYSAGQVTGGWDAWNFGGKNPDSQSSFWAFDNGGVFDEPAYSRFLNPYVYPARIRMPTGYANSGSGATWTFIHGHPTAPDRASLQIPVFRSPGDVATRQRNWPNPTPGISAYNDIGTSYVQNMNWWNHPSFAGLSFTAEYAEGARRIGLALGGANPNFVWISDQTASIVGGGGGSFTGEFGTLNASVVGWADGRAKYIQVVPGAYSGPNYTFIP